MTRSRSQMSKWQYRTRIGLTLLYAAAGLFHLFRLGVFLAITPSWVPFAREVILFTGLCELAGCVGLWDGRLSKAAAIGLSLYAVCVYPANIKHAMIFMGTPGRSLWPWLYHLPRLALQPVLVWLPLFAANLTTWPFQKRPTP